MYVCKCVSAVCGRSERGVQYNMYNGHTLRRVVEVGVRDDGGDRWHGGRSRGPTCRSRTVVSDPKIAAAAAARVEKG